MNLTILTTLEEMDQIIHSLSHLSRQEQQRVIRYLMRSRVAIDPDADWNGWDRSEWSGHVVWQKRDGIDLEEIRFLTLYPEDEDAWEHLSDFSMLSLIFFEGDADFLLAHPALYEAAKQAPMELCIRCRDRSLFPSLDDDGDLACSLGTSLMGMGARDMAIEYYQLSAQKGNAFASYNLGFLYEHGIGGDIDLPLALSCYQQALDAKLPFVRWRYRICQEKMEDA